MSWLFSADGCGEEGRTDPAQELAPAANRNRNQKFQRSDAGNEPRRTQPAPGARAAQRGRPCAVPNPAVTAPNPGVTVPRPGVTVPLAGSGNIAWKQPLRAVLNATRSRSAHSSTQLFAFTHPLFTAASRERPGFAPSRREIVRLLKLKLSKGQ